MSMPPHLAADAGQVFTRQEARAARPAFANLARPGSNDRAHDHVVSCERD